MRVLGETAAVILDSLQANGRQARGTEGCRAAMGVRSTAGDGRDREDEVAVAVAGADCGLRITGGA